MLTLAFMYDKLHVQNYTTSSAGQTAIPFASLSIRLNCVHFDT